MAYYEDMNKLLDLPQGLLCNSYVELINGRYCIINGHKGIREFSEQYICVRQKNGDVKIEGEQLKILALTPTELYVSGVIKGIIIDEQ